MELGAALGLVEGWVREGIVPGVAVAVARRGAVLGERYAGKQAAGAGRPVEAGTLYPVASITKPFTATAAVRLAERGVLSLDEPVRRLVTAFGGADGAAKREVTLRDLLCHTAGLPKDDPVAGELWAGEADFDAVVGSAAGLPLAQPPGSRVAYSNAGYWVAGGAVAAAAGVPFAEALRREVLGPFGLRETFVDPPVTVWERIARRYGPNKVVNTPYGRALASPSGGLLATARDLVRFASVFLGGGVTPDGDRVLSAAAVAAMTTDQTGGLPGGIDELQTWSVCLWGLGWEIKGHKSHHWTGDLTSPRTISHLGASGCLLWADPATGLAVAILANRDLGTGWHQVPARWARLSNAIVAAATADDPIVAASA